MNSKRPDKKSKEQIERTDQANEPNREAEVRDLIKKLTKYDTPSERLKALEKLAELRDERAAEPIGKLLNDPKLDDPEMFVFVDAVRALEKIGNQTAIKALIKAMVIQDRYFDKAEPGPHSSDYTMSALQRIGEPAIPELLKALYNDAWIGDGRIGRWRAAWTLGQMRDATAVPGLRKALSDGGNDVRPSVALALGHIGDRRAVPDLIKTLQKDPNMYVRERAANSLERMADPAAATALTQAALNDPASNVRVSCGKALRALGDEVAVPVLIQMLQDRTDWVASGTARILEGIGTPEALAALKAQRQQQ